MAARKSASKTTTKKPAAKKAATKKPAAKKAAAKKAAAKKAAAKKPVAKKAAAKPKAKDALAKDVHVGHVFALKPRVDKSFRRDDFRQAKELLQDEAYESPAAAARAVAEKALELTRKGPPKRGFGSR